MPLRPLAAIDAFATVVAVAAIMPVAAILAVVEVGTPTPVRAVAPFELLMALAILAAAEAFAPILALIAITAEIAAVWPVTTRVAAATIHAILAESLVSLAKIAPAITVSIAAITVALLLMPALCEIPVAVAIALLALVAGLPVVLPRLTRIEHPRLLVVRATLRLGLVTDAVVAFLATFLAGLERLAWAGERTMALHPAIHPIATVLLHLLLAVGEYDAVVVLGVLQVVLGQYMIAGRQRIARQRHILFRYLSGRAMDLMIRPVRLVGTHQRVMMMLAFAILIVVIVVVIATAASAVLLSLPHGTLFSRASCLKAVAEGKSKTVELLIDVKSQARAAGCAAAAARNGAWPEWMTPDIGRSNRAQPHKLKLIVIQTGYLVLASLER